MVRPVDIVLVGRSMIWSNMIASTKKHILKNMCNIHDELSLTKKQRIDAVLLNAEGLSIKKIKSKIQTYRNLSVFIVNAKNAKNLIRCFPNVVGINDKEISIYNCIRVIRFFIGRRMDLSFGFFQDYSLDIEESLIVAALESGLSNKQIARKFDISLPAVKYYLQRVYNRLGVEGRDEVAFKADKIIV